MKLPHNLTQVIPIEVGIDFCCSDRLMAEHFLHCPQIGASFYEVGGE